MPDNVKIEPTKKEMLIHSWKVAMSHGRMGDAKLIELELKELKRIEEPTKIG